MNTYKLKYADKTAAIDDLIDKGVVTSWSFTDEDETEKREKTYSADTDEEETEKRAKTYSAETVAVVWVGEIEEVDGYHVDIMTAATIEFDNAIEPTNPVHTFA